MHYAWVQTVVTGDFLRQNLHESNALHVSCLATLIWPGQNRNTTTLVKIDIILHDRQGILWIGTADGHLVRYTGTKSQRSFKTYAVNSQGKVRWKKIEDLKQDPHNDSLFWIGTGGNGLIRLNKYSVICANYV